MRRSSVDVLDDSTHPVAVVAVNSYLAGEVEEQASALIAVKAIAVPCSFSNPYANTLQRQSKIGDGGSFV
jgi:hypothetical protein